MRKMLLAFLLLLPMAGCTSVSYNGSRTLVDKVSYPEIGKVVTAQVGEHMVEKGSLVKEKVLRVNRTIDGWAYDIPAKSYQQIGHDAQDGFYEATGVTRNPFADPFKALAVPKKSGSEICVVTVFGIKSCYEGDYEIISRISTSVDSFQQTLIYNGRVGDKINIGYREFSNNVARPAFSNEVEYDLSASDRIGYKGASIEVIEAGNSSITYRLLESFPD